MKEKQQNSESRILPSEETTNKEEKKRLSKLQRMGLILSLILITTLIVVSSIVSICLPGCSSYTQNVEKEEFKWQNNEGLLIVNIDSANGISTKSFWGKKEKIRVLFFKFAGMDGSIERPSSVMVVVKLRVNQGLFALHFLDEQKKEIESLEVRGGDEGTLKLVLSTATLKHGQYRVTAKEAKGIHYGVFFTFPETAAEYYTLGGIYLEKYQLSKAVDAYKESITLDPKNADVYNDYGYVLYLQRDYEGAIAKYKKALEIEPNHENAHFLLGLVYSDKGLREQSIAEFKTVIKINPKDAGAYEMIGAIKADQKKYNEATEWFSKAMKINPDNAWVHLHFGYNVYLQKEQFAEAISEFQKAMQLEPDEDEHIRAIGWAYLLQGDHERANEWFQKAISIDPDDPKTYNGLAELYITIGSFEHAETMALKAKELSKRPHDMIYSLFMATFVKVLSREKYDQTLKELLSTMKEGKYFNLKGDDFTVIERTIDKYTLDPERKRLAQRIILLVKGDIEPNNFR